MRHVVFPTKTKRRKSFFSIKKLFENTLRNEIENHQKSLKS
jgi:hypothetical protein